MAIPNEVRLYLGLMLKGEEVPASIKDSAIAALKTVSMMIPEDNADAYLMDRLIGAFESQDQDEIDDVCELIGITYGDDIGEMLAGTGKPERLEPTDEVTRLVDDAVDGFSDAYNDEHGKPVAQGVLKVMNDKGFVPLMFEDGVLIGFSQDTGAVIAFFVNAGDMSRKDALAKFEGIGKDDVFRAVKEQWGINRIDVEMLALDFKMAGDDAFELKTHPLEGGW